MGPRSAIDPRHLAPRVAVALALAAAPGAASAQNAASPAPAVAATDVARKLEIEKTELENKQHRTQELQRSVAEIAAEREEINARLLSTAALVQESEAKLTAIEGRLSELEAQEKVLRGSLAERYEHISHLLAALQRMGRNPPPVIITRREDALKMVRSAMLLATAFPEMRTQALELADKLNELVRVMTSIRSEGDRLRAENDRLNDMRTRLSGLLESKKNSLAERQSELTEVRQAAAEISKNVSDLNELITKLDQEVQKTPALQEHEAESQRQIAAAGQEAPAGAGAAGAKPSGSAGDSEKVALLVPPPASAPPGSVVELAPAMTSLVPGNPGRIKPAIAFELAKAKLPLPAQGRRVISFGDKTQYGANSKGLVIETRPGAQVTSPCDGWIVYAGEFRSYGQLLIINAGGGYHVLVAGLSQIDVQPGQFVLAAEPVGTMAGPIRTATAATDESAPASSPVLYVEFRKDGQPIDPEPWWVVHQKVQ